MSNCRECSSCHYRIGGPKPVHGVYHVFECFDNRMVEANYGEPVILDEVPIVVGVSCLKYLSAPEQCPRKGGSEWENQVSSVPVEKMDS